MPREGSARIGPSPRSRRSPSTAPTSGSCGASVTPPSGRSGVGNVFNKNLDENINDKYFARVKAEKSKKKDDIFEAKREAYKPSKLRKDMAPTTTYSSIPSKVTNNIFRNLGKNCKRPFP